MSLLFSPGGRRRARLAAPYAVVALSVALLAGCGGLDERESLAAEGDQGAVTAGPDPDGSAAASGGTGLQPDDEQTSEVPQACLDAVAAAGSGTTASAGPSDGSSDGPSDGSSEDSAPNAELFPAFEACGSVEDFRQAASATDDVLSGNDPAQFVVTTCGTEEAVVDSPLCESLGGAEPTDASS